MSRFPRIKFHGEWIILGNGGGHPSTSTEEMLERLKNHSIFYRSPVHMWSFGLAHDACTIYVVGHGDAIKLTPKHGGAAVGPAQPKKRGRPVRGR